MWFNDLERAVYALGKFLGKGVYYVTIEKINPCADGGIVFQMSNHDRLKWFPEDYIEVYKEGSWRNG